MKIHLPKWTSSCRAARSQAKLHEPEALAFLADEVVDRHFDVVEMHFVYFVRAVQQDDRLDRNAG